MAGGDLDGKRALGAAGNIALLERELGKVEYRRAKLAASEKERAELDLQRAQLLKALDAEMARHADLAGGR